MITELQSKAKTRMGKSIDSLATEFTRIRSGRAHPSLLEHLMVSYYGNDTPLHQVAAVTVDDPRCLLVTPWENAMVPVIEKAIMTSDLGLNPSTRGRAIRVPLPPLTEERRQGLVKIVRDEAEKARVAVRNIRREANNDIKELSKDKQISEDDERRAVEKIQKITDESIKEIDALLATKEKDLMAI